MKRQKNRASTVIVIMIIILIVALGGSAFVYFFFKPENTTDRDIGNMARDYYENYLYVQYEKLASEKTVEEILQKYVETGLPDVTLRQLLLFDDAKYANYRDSVETYCDTNHSYITYYPVTPFEKNNYEIKYDLSCQFD